MKAAGYKIPLFEGSVFKKTIESRAPAICGSVEFFKHMTTSNGLKLLAAGVAKIIGSKKVLMLPLLAGDKCLGIVALGSSREPISTDVERLTNFSRQAGLAVEKAHLNEELQKAYEELKDINRVKSDIIANVSHELRTPLTIAKGMMELAMDEKDEGERKSLLTIGRAALLKHDRIIGDMVTVSQFYKKDYRLSIEAVALEQVILLAMKEFESGARNLGISVNAALEKDMDVKADFNELKHAMCNLLDNAIKFNKRGGRVTIEARSRGRFAEVCIADTGIGIAKEHMGKLFAPLHQLDPSTTRRHSGTGCGLAAVKGIVEAHGGRIWAESEVGKGSRFYFTILLSKSA